MRKTNRPRRGGRHRALWQSEQSREDLEALALMLPQDCELVLRYPLPRWYDTEEEYRRAFNEDVGELSDFRLWQEEVKAQVALAFVDLLDPDGQRVAQWLVHRLAAVRRERGRRRAAG